MNLEWQRGLEGRLSPWVVCSAVGTGWARYWAVLIERGNREFCGMMEIFCFDCSCVFSMSCIICQNSNSLVSMLCSSLCNLYLKTTFWKGKKPNALKLCSKSQEGIRFATPCDCRRKSSWPWSEHRYPVHTKGKEQTHAFPYTCFSYSTLMNSTISLFSISSYKTPASTMQ